MQGAEDFRAGSTTNLAFRMANHTRDVGMHSGFKYMPDHPVTNHGLNEAIRQKGWYERKKTRPRKPRPKDVALTGSLRTAQSVLRKAASELLARSSEYMESSQS